MAEKRKLARSPTKDLDKRVRADRVFQCEVASRELNRRLGFLPAGLRHSIWQQILRRSLKWRRLCVRTGQRFRKHLQWKLQSLNARPRIRSQVTVTWRSRPSANLAVADVWRWDTPWTKHGRKHLAHHRRRRTRPPERPRPPNHQGKTATLTVAAAGLYSPPTTSLQAALRSKQWCKPAAFQWRRSKKIDIYWAKVYKLANKH